VAAGKQKQGQDSEGPKIPRFRKSALSVMIF